MRVDQQQGSPYQPARDAFARLADTLRAEPQALRELEAALAELIGPYNTVIYENRFLVGGAVEVFFIAAMRYAGLDVTDVGASNMRADFMVGGRIPFSVKSHLRGNPRSFRLINVLGSSEGAAWSEATIFVVHSRGFGYADPELLPDKAYRVSDAVLLRSRDVFALWDERPELFVECAVPTSNTEQATSRLASRTVANDILRERRLLRPIE